jgi:hypothetical protein
MKIFCTHYLALALLLSASVARAEVSEPARSYGVGVNLYLGRGWGAGDADNSLSAGGHVLFLQEHFHVGPALSYSRDYSGPSSYYSVGGGLTAKWTYENLQTASQTPFAEVSGYYRKDEYRNTLTIKTRDTFWSVGAGYETFLNSFVSIAPSLQWSKSWTIQSTEDNLQFVDFGKSRHTNKSRAKMQLDLNVYL